MHLGVLPFALLRFHWLMTHGVYPEPPCPVQHIEACGVLQRSAVTLHHCVLLL